MKIKTKVLAPVSLLAFIALVVCVLSIIANTIMSNNTRELKETSMAKLDAAVTVNENLQTIHKVVLSHCINTNELMMEGYEEQLAELCAESVAAMEVLSNLAKGNVEAEKQMTSLTKLQNDFFTVVNNVIDISGQALEAELAEAAAAAETTDTTTGTTTTTTTTTDATTDGTAVTSETLRTEATTLANGQLAQKATLVNSGLKRLEEEAELEIAGKADSVAALCEKLGGIMIIVIVVVIVAALGSVVVCVTKITNPIAKLNKKLVAIVEEVAADRGDLTDRVPVVSKDEIGTVAKNINHFIETLQGIMSQVIGGAQDLERVTVDVNNSLEAANDSVNDTSAVMEELAASMEEIAATIADVNSNMTDVDESVVGISDNANSIKVYAGDMKQRAQQLEENAQGNRERIQQMTEEITERLKISIQNSKSVDRVNDLTNEILNISSQTNLLALNASIEAARAGEAGRGFAVVADEIRQLADSSRETANNIQQINAAVVKAVRDLGAESQSLVEYLEKTILPDYDGFVEAGQKYSGDAVYLDGEMKSFYEMTEEMKQLIQSITASIAGITAAIDDSANGVGTAAESATKLAEEMKTVNDQMEISNQVADNLKQQADRFVAV
ncbi:MAG: HAMP domain-containing protein [Lachnospiraceae bacterium]|nr:HAMP domain-containing protein [Lachnospiraceae bacterium]